jgi:hypothetical protein
VLDDYFQAIGAMGEIIRRFGAATPAPPLNETPDPTRE